MKRILKQIKYAFVWLYCKVRYAFALKDASEIPFGPYCYTRVGASVEPLDPGKIIPCPHYKWVGGMAWCSLMNMGEMLLDDMVKICFINEGWDEEED